MSEVKRISVFIHGPNKKIDMVEAAQLDRVTAERDALQQRLTAADERADRLEAGIKWESDRNALLLASLTEAEDMLSVTSLEAGQRIAQLDSLLSRWADLLGVSAPGLRDETLAALKPAESQQCQFPQACTSNCPCKADDIPDFSPGNGNKARRRAAAIEALKPENQRIVPVDPSTICLKCFGTGTICTGILEASSTICNGCNGCNGTGREQP